MTRMSNDEVLMTNQSPNDPMMKFGHSPFLGHSCLDIRHYPVTIQAHSGVIPGMAGRRRRPSVNRIEEKIKKCQKSQNPCNSGAHLTFCATCVSPSPPQTCGGEGWGEEALFGNPSPCPPPRWRGARGLKSVGLPTPCQKQGCAPWHQNHKRLFQERDRPGRIRRRPASGICVLFLFPLL